MRRLNSLFGMLKGVFHGFLEAIFFVCESLMKNGLIYEVKAMNRFSILIALIIVIQSTTLNAEPKGLWTHLGSPFAASKICVTTENFSTRVWALNFDRTLWFNDNFGKDSDWEFYQTVSDVRDIACVGSDVYVLNDAQHIWRLSNTQSSLRDRWDHISYAWNAKFIGGGERLTALNYDGSMWYFTFTWNKFKAENYSFEVGSMKIDSTLTPFTIDGGNLMYAPRNRTKWIEIGGRPENHHGILDFQMLNRNEAVVLIFDQNVDRQLFHVRIIY